jgi:hypothetical protein
VTISQEVAIPFGERKVATVEKVAANQYPESAGTLVTPIAPAEPAIVSFARNSEMVPALCPLVHFARSSVLRRSRL